MRQSFYFLLLLTVSYLSAQSTDIPLNFWSYDILDEWDVKSETGAFTTVKPVSRKQFAELSGQVNWSKSKAEHYDLEYVRHETREYQDSVRANKNPLFGKLFQYPADLFSVNTADFDLHVNPIVVLAAGGDQLVTNDELLFENYRGLELRGTVDDKVSFYTLLAENQARYPEYVQQLADTALAVPYEGFWKQYGDTGVDFLRARGYIDFNATKHIGLQFGFGKHFIGDGRRSLILSDIGNSYPYLRIKTQVWKIQYTNLFAQLIAETDGGDFGLLGIGSFPKKYFAHHHLSIQIKPNLTIGLFESVIQGDSTGSTGIGIYNPIIFYKALEQQDGSAGNTILGLDFKWNLWKRISFYGQFVIDELIVSEAFGDNDWWGNKQGFQLGGKYFDAFGLKELNLQMEINRVRPYVYAHESNFTSYSHYNMALAHPLGANFSELLISGNFRPLPKLKLQADWLLAKYGNDQNNLSYGRDILESYVPENRPGDYRVTMFHGNETDLMMLQFQAQYMIMHNMLLEANVIIRNESNASFESNAQIFGLALRWNFPSRSYLF